MLTVHLRINDAATGKPTPVRLRISGPDGTTFAPLGRFPEFATRRNEDVGGHLLIGRERWCYTDGSCEVKLPAGVPLRIQATKGPEYSPLDQTITLSEGKMALRFAVERWSNLAGAGWVSGDSRCHFLSPHTALLEAAAEDVAVVNLLACSQPVPSLDGTAYLSLPNLTAFSGQSPALEADGRLVAVNTLNAHPVLGRVGLLHSHRVVYPITFGGDEVMDDWSVCDWCDQCHRKGGLAVWVDAFRPAGGQLGGEALVAAVLGKIDAVEVDDQPLLPWLYRLWSAGVLLPLVGGSGKDSNRVALGGTRTYARVDPSPKRERRGPYREWIESVRAGRTFVTNGPLLTFEVRPNGLAGPGSREMIATATARSRTPFDRLEVVTTGGRPLGEAAASQSDVWSATIELPFLAVGSHWVAARVVGPDGALAHTSPVVVRSDDQPPPRPDAAAALTQLIEDTARWIEDHGRFSNPKSKVHLLALCAAARAKLGGPI
jgi:hypothetical protein